MWAVVSEAVPRETTPIARSKVARARFAKALTEFETAVKRTPKN